MNVETLRLREDERRSTVRPTVTLNALRSRSSIGSVAASPRTAANTTAVAYSCQIGANVARAASGTARGF